MNYINGLLLVERFFALERLIGFSGYCYIAFLSIPFSKVKITTAPENNMITTKPFLMGSARHVHAGQRVAIGGSIGILFYFSEQMMGQLAILFDLSPAPAALAPDVFLLALALLFLRRIH